MVTRASTAALLGCALTVVFAAAGGCRRIPEEPLKLERNMLTVTNTSSSDWDNVEIWVNTYFRVTAASVPAGGKFQAPLDTFVAGFGQRFDVHRTAVKDLRLTARLPDGSPLEIKKQSGGLAGALGGKR